MVDHKQVAILDPTSNQMVEVDEGIAPLLKAIWDLGIAACNSCQENKPRLIWIEFMQSEDAEAFLNRVISGLDPVNSPETNNWLYSRITGQNDGWQYSAHPHDFREYIDELNGTVELNASETCGDYTMDIHSLSSRRLRKAARPGRWIISDARMLVL